MNVDDNIIFEQIWHIFLLIPLLNSNTNILNEKEKSTENQFVWYCICLTVISCFSSFGQCLVSRKS